MLFVTMKGGAWEETVMMMIRNSKDVTKGGANGNDNDNELHNQYNIR
jgi:hypothetical protein